MSTNRQSKEEESEFRNGKHGVEERQKTALAKMLHHHRLKVFPGFSPHHLIAETQNQVGHHEFRPHSCGPRLHPHHSWQTWSTRFEQGFCKLPVPTIVTLSKIINTSSIYHGPENKCFCLCKQFIYLKTVIYFSLTFPKLHNLMSFSAQCRALAFLLIPSKPLQLVLLRNYHYYLHTEYADVCMSCHLCLPNLEE